ncbi:MAG: SGNH/GDSL hydrolase family protein, partial [Pseudonocardiaceae bacterium]
ILSFDNSDPPADQACHISRVQGQGGFVGKTVAGRLRLLRRVVALLAGVVTVLIAAVSTAAASPATIMDGRAALAINAGDARVRQAPVNYPVDYVALGDSYSSGVGTGVYDAASGDCARSPLSYPPLWAEEHQPASFRFVACSGATTTDVRGNQITALGPDTDLVTITVGGNDVGFGPVLQTCTVAENDRTCFAAVDAAEAYARSVLPGRLARTYAEIRSAAPYAQVIVLGYPRLFDLAPNCADPLAPNLARREKLNEGSDVLNTVIQKTVGQQLGFSFSDVRGWFASHGVCSADPWINGPSVPTFVGPYHPNQTGYREGYLNALNAATGRGAAAA